MWGSYVSGELEKARQNAKNNKQAQQRQKMVIRKLLEEKSPYRNVGVSEEKRELPPVNNTRGRFRDPISVIRPEG